MVPKLSAPLVKDIRTGEGIAEWALGSAIVALTAVGDLGVAKGATYLTILAAVKGTRRGLIKIVGLQKRAGIDAPTVPSQLDVLGVDAENALAQVQQALTEQVAVQDAPGTDAGAIVAGLSPATEVKPEAV